MSDEQQKVVGPGLLDLSALNKRLSANLEIQLATRQALYSALAGSEGAPELVLTDTKDKIRCGLATLPQPICEDIMAAAMAQTEIEIFTTWQDLLAVAKRANMLIEQMHTQATDKPANPQEKNTFPTLLPINPLEQEEQSGPIEEDDR